MDFDWVKSLDLESCSEWTNVTSFGKSKLKAAQMATLIQLLFPNSEYKNTQRIHWFKLRQCLNAINSGG